MPKIVDHDIRRRQIVDAAWRVIAREGLDQATVRQIAGEAGCSSGVLAHYFKDKDDLLVHALQFSHEAIDERSKSALRRASSYTALLELLLDNLPLDDQRRFETRIEMSFWGRALVSQELAEVQRSNADALRQLIRSLVVASREELGAGRCDPELIVDALHGLIDGLSLHALLYPNIMTPHRQARAMRACLDLLLGPALQGSATQSGSGAVMQAQGERGPRSPEGSGKGLGER